MARVELRTNPTIACQTLAMPGGESTIDVDVDSVDTFASVALPTIPATAWAVLGLLSFERELSGYELKRWSDSILAFFYTSPAMSQIYTELQRLEDLGLVVGRSVARDDAREKRIYSITPRGIGALRKWQDEVDTERTMLKHGLLMRLWLGHLAEPDRLRERITNHRRELENELAQAERSLEGSGGLPERVFPELVVRWTIARLTDEIALTDRMIADIDALVGDRTDATTNEEFP